MFSYPEHAHPQHDMEEGLVISTMEPRFAGPRMDSARTETMRQIKQEVRRGKKVLVATDGSRDEGKNLVGWGAMVVDVNGMSSDVKGSVPGADQTSWASELEAVCVVLNAIEDMEEEVEVTIAIDFKSVQNATRELIEVKEKGGNLNAMDFMSKCGFGRWGKVKNSLKQIKNVKIKAVWILSHGEKDNWTPEKEGFGNTVERRMMPLTIWQNGP